MLSTKSTIAYPSIYYRILIFLFAAHFIVSYGEPESFLELLLLPYYYTALFGSFTIALVAGEWVLAVSRYLDGVKPWVLNFKRRLWWQLSLGVALTALLAVLMTAIYFWIRGRNIVDSGYFKYDFTLMVCFVVFLNLVYLIIAQTQGMREQIKYRFTNKRKPVSAGQQPAEIAAIYTAGSGCVAVLKSGESVIWSKTLGQSLNELPDEAYFLINRSDIVSRDVIDGYELTESRRLKLILKWPLRNQHTFVVSQRKVVAFKRWYNVRLSK